MFWDVPLCNIPNASNGCLADNVHDIVLYNVMTYVVHPFGISVGTGGLCRQKNWQNSVLFLVSCHACLVCG